MTESSPRRAKSFLQATFGQWKGFIGGLIVMLVPLYYQSQRAQEKDWREVERAVTELVNTVIDVDSIGSDVQPDHEDPLWKRVSFVRDHQTRLHPDAWDMFERQIPSPNQRSGFLPFIAAVEGHWSVGERAHGKEIFARAALRQSTKSVQANFDGQVFDAPIELLSLVQSFTAEELIPTAEPGKHVRWFVLSDDEMAHYWTAPQLDLSDPEIRGRLIDAGIVTSELPQTAAVPALYDLSDKEYRVEAFRDFEPWPNSETEQ